MNAEDVLRGLKDNDTQVRRQAIRASESLKNHSSEIGNAIANCPTLPDPSIVALEKALKQLGVEPPPK